MFLVFINDVVDNIESDINLFADDTSLLNIVDQIQTTYAIIENDLKRLSSWANQWLVTYNAAKTVSLHISTKRNRVNHPILTLNGTPVEETDSHCHLGIDLENGFTWQTHIMRISKKASKCVGLMRRVCRDLPRSCLENLYTTMVRPILEYGNMLLDGSPLAHTTHLDKVQREAALVCTGAYKHTRNINLMEELGWDSLDVRRKNQKVCLMFKIQNDLVPTYLAESCPPLVGEATTYNLRNAADIALPPGNKQGYSSSFFPSTVRLWNSLDVGIKNKDTIDSFKYHLKKAKCLKKNKLYPKFSGVNAIQQTRLRLGLSGLKDHRHSYNHINNSTCDHCGARKEDAMHYLLQCPNFNRPRVVLLDAVRNLYLSKHIVFDLNRTIVKKELVSYMLKGDSRLSDQENTALFSLVQQFICVSKRF